MTRRKPPMPARAPYSIAIARPDEYEAIGELLVHTYSTLPGMPRVIDQPEYYARLRDVGARAANAAITVMPIEQRLGSLPQGDFKPDPGLDDLSGAES